MTSPLERINALIAKAVDTSTTEEERRSCAVLACKLISTTGVVLSMPGQQRDEPNTTSGGPSWSAEGVRVTGLNFDDPELVELLRQVVGHGFGAAVDAFVKNTPSKPPRASRPYGKSYDARAANAGICFSCKKRYVRGDRVQYRSDIRQMIHYVCEWPDDGSGQEGKEPA